MTFSYEDLAKRAGVNPWELRDKLAAGNPAEITNLAKAFADASGDAKTASDLAAEAEELKSQGYQVDNTPVGDPAGHVQKTKQQLGGGGEKMAKIARLLNEVSDDLETRTTTAKTSVTSLEGEIRSIESAWNTFWQKNHNSMDQSDYESARNGYVEQAVAKVREYGGPIKTSLDEYEKNLAAHLKSMADLGYIPPSELDEGPGDIGAVSGKDAANATVDAANRGDKAKFEESTRYLDLLNAKEKAGVPLSDAEKAWLKDYYNTVTPHLPEIKKWADNTLCLADNAKPDPNNEITKLAGRVATGLLTLSREVPYGEMPQAVRDMVDGNIGTTDKRYNEQGARMPEGFPPSGDNNLKRFAGFVDFIDDYAATDAKPGKEFAQHLGDAAIRWKQQINVMYANYGEHVESANRYTAGPGDSNDLKAPSPEQWNKLFPDELCGDALGIVGRNAQFSNEWLTNDHEARRQIMGMNWQDGHGASEVILAGTLPSTEPGDEVNAKQASTAALSVVRDAAADYDGLANMANRDVKAAIGVMGSAYVDSFIREPTASTPGLTDIQLLNGKTVAGFDLDDGTHANFLKFLAATDPPEVYGHFRAEAEKRSTQYVEWAIQSGHDNPNDPVYAGAVRDAMRVNGYLDGASAGVLRDMAAEHVGDDKLKLESEQQAYAKAMGEYEKHKGIADGAKTIADWAGLVPELKPAAGTAGFAIDQATKLFLEEPKNKPDYAAYIQSTQGAIADLAKSQQVEAYAQATMPDTLAKIVADAHANTGHPPVDSAGHPIKPNPDGSMPATYRNQVYDSVAASVRDEGGVALHQVIGLESSNRESGTGYQAQWTLGDPRKAGSLNDSGGNWSNNDDRYRIYYGDETRYDYKDRGTWSGWGWEKDMPDDKPDTKTAPIDSGHLPATTR